MKIILLNEHQYERLSNAKDILGEDVYVNNVKQRGSRKTANLTYRKGGGINRGNKMSYDMIKTDKMDSDGSSSTYEVPLKGGIMSYNITDINGTEVMHYFKRRFSKQRTQAKIGSNIYDIEMQDSEFQTFMNTFLTKVGNVVAHESAEIKNKNNEVDFKQVCVYPVPSSSNFNVEMSKQIIQHNHTICGLPVVELDTKLLVKSMKNITIDKKFINKNKEYYSQIRFKSGNVDDRTHLNDVNNTLSQLKSYSNIDVKINTTNEIVKQILDCFYQVNNKLKQDKLTEDLVIRLGELFEQYQSSVQDIVAASEWFDEVSEKTHIRRLSTIAKALKRSKPESIDKRTDFVYELLKSYGLLNGNYKNKIQKIQYWEPINFEMKKLGNDVRMALMGYFDKNEDDELVQTEIDKTIGNVVVVFDDNISGGATLSDICLKLQSLGVKYIIPITFGKMRESYNQGMNIRINAPEGGFNF